MGIPYDQYLAMQARTLAARTSAEKCGKISAAPDEGPEHRLHERILAHCRDHKWPVIHARMDRESTIANGAPDFTILADRARVFLIECKTAKGKLSIDQMAFGILAEVNGHKVHVVRSFDAFLEIVS